MPGLEEPRRGRPLTDVPPRPRCASCRREAGERVFLHFAPYAVHAPLMVNLRVADRFESAGLAPAELAYASLVASVDDALGRILATLDELGIAEDTLTVYTSDNGGLSAHSRGAKHGHNAPFRSGAGRPTRAGRVPMIVCGPGVLGGGRHGRCGVTHDPSRPKLARRASRSPRPDGAGRRRSVAPVGRRGGVPDRHRLAPTPLLRQRGSSPSAPCASACAKPVLHLAPRSTRRRGAPRRAASEPTTSGDLSRSATWPRRRKSSSPCRGGLSKELERRGASMSLALPDRVPVPLPRALARSRAAGAGPPGESPLP